MSPDSLPTIQLDLRPDLIDLGWGHPDPALLPVEAMRRAAQATFEHHGPDALAYGADRGAGPLLAWLIERIARVEGHAPAPDKILVTGGVSQALDQLCTLCTRPGDVVLVESPTYHLAVRILRDHPLELAPIPFDLDGLQVERLAELLANMRLAGRRISFLYTIPTFHNPTGVCLSMDRRRALVDLAAREGLLIVEDDVYRELAYDGPAPPSLWSLAPSGVVARLGSFAKSLAPGLRLGWLTGDTTLVSRLTGCGLLDSGGGVNHFASLVVSELCAAGDFEVQGERLRAAYRARRDALLEALAASLPAGCTIAPPGGGFFVWVQLPPGSDAAELLSHAEAAGVSYLPGARFHLDGAGQATLRLAFSLYAPDDLREAARRLGAVLHRAIQD
jgi:DNA-binding transcriptional MocR family regulator